MVWELCPSILYERPGSQVAVLPSRLIKNKKLFVISSKEMIGGFKLVLLVVTVWPFLLAFDKNLSMNWHKNWKKF